MAIIISVQRLLVSIGVLSIAGFAAVLNDLWFPAISQFVDNELPLIWLSLNSWLTPPYLYIIINGIIITIAASSRYQQQHKNHHHHKISKQQHDQAWTAPPSKMNHPDSSRDFAHYDHHHSHELLLNNPVEERHGFGASFMDYEENLEAEKIPVVNMPEFQPLVPEMEDDTTEPPSLAVAKAVAISAATEEESEDEILVSDSFPTLNRGDSMEFSSEKPPVSARFSHRRTVKGSPEGGKGLRVSKPKRHDTLESTWKTITEGRSVPLARHLKKSDTWQMQNAGPIADDLMKVNKKSESFVKERDSQTQSTPLTVSSRGSVGKTVKREPSLSQDELNRRVEAFIKKFNEEMRLQREESLDQYKELINKRVGPI